MKVLLLFRLQCEPQWIARLVGFCVRFVDAFFRLGFGERLHVRRSVDMRGEHDIRGFIVRKVKAGFQDLHDKIHRRHVVVVDDDFVERFKFGIGLFDDLDFGNNLQIHFLPQRITKEEG